MSARTDDILQYTTSGGNYFRKKTRAVGEKTKTGRTMLEGEKTVGNAEEAGSVDLMVVKLSRGKGLTLPNPWDGRTSRRCFSRWCSLKSFEFGTVVVEVGELAISLFLAADIEGRLRG